MKIDKITYTKAFVTGPFLQEKLGMDILIDTANGETPEAAYTLAKQIVEQWHKENNPGLEISVNPEYAHLVPSIAPPREIQVSKEPEEVRIGVLVEDIENVTDLVVLESYRLLVKNHPALQSAYNKRHQELLNK